MQNICKQGFAIVTILTMVGTAPWASAQYTNKSSVLDGSGTLSSGGTYTNISAAGQPGGIAVSSQGDYVNQAGFLNTFFLKGDLDTDGDGLADEADQDNDGDTLADATEIDGSSFDPTISTDVNNPDSDDDGMSDGSESVAGTNPQDVNALLEIVYITNSAGGRTVGWTARGNNQRMYRVRTENGAYAMPGENDVIFSNTVAGGSAPWYMVTNSITDATATNAEFFAVDVRMP